MPEIRRAKLEDAPEIHSAHMTSILEVCKDDYSEAQLNAWGRRPYREERVQRSIKDNYVWVVETHGAIEGYAEFEKQFKEGETIGYISGLYLTPKVMGKGLGKQMLIEIEKLARSLGLKQVYLHSTLTSLPFYESKGYLPIGEQTEVSIGGAGIPCVPMSKEISEIG